jgi:hypothetical protein
MSTSSQINIFVRRIGSQLTIPVTNETTIDELIAVACQRENLSPEERYQLVINDIHLRVDTRLLKNANTVADENLFHLGSTDQICLSTKPSYVYMEQLASEQARAERIAALIRARTAANDGSPHRTDARASESILSMTDEEIQSLTLQPTDTSVRPAVALDLDGVGSGIDAFPRGLVQDYVHAALTEFNAMLVGAPGTGKRPLISAICGTRINRLPILPDAETDENTPYTIRHSYRTERRVTECAVNFWTTRGIENWSDANIRQYVDRIKAKENLMCMIYCISPNGFADPEQIKYILAECVRARIFVALVVTNMYAGPATNEILEMLNQMLAEHSTVTQQDDDMTYYGHVGLCTKVNSEVFTTQNGEEYPVKGVDELTLAITRSLSPEKAIGWGLLLIENGPFWLRNHARIFKMLDAVRSYLPSWW